MRIALFADTYLPDVNGVSRTLGRLVRHAGSRGHEVALITPRIPAPEEDSTVEDRATLHYRLPGIPVPLYPELTLGRPIDAGAREALREFGPEVIHVATEATVGWSGRRWALKSDVPLVTSFHTDFAAYVGGYGLGLLERPVWKYLRSFHDDAVMTFCPSTATRTRLWNHGFHERIRIWSRGIDEETFSPAHRKEEVRWSLAPGTERILLYVGRIAPEKRLEVLFRAFPDIRHRSPVPTALVLVGDGPHLRRLRDRDVAGVHFTGFLTGESLAEAYAAGDVFVFPSDTETFGNVVLEALASGLPVVAPDRGGYTDVVRHDENGILIPPGDAEAMTGACLHLLENEVYRRRLGRAARTTAERQDWSRILDGVLRGWRETAEGDPSLLQFDRRSVTPGR